jgi:hypothetical protein
VAFPWLPYSTNLYIQNDERLQLVFFSLSGAENQAWCPDHMDERMTAELILLSRSEKLHINLSTV